MRLVSDGTRLVNMERVVQIVDEQDSITVVYESGDAVTPPREGKVEGTEDAKAFRDWIAENAINITSGKRVKGTKFSVHTDTGLSDKPIMARFVTLNHRTFNIAQIVSVEYAGKGTKGIPYDKAEIVFTAVRNPSPWLTVTLTGDEAEWFSSYIKDQAEPVKFAVPTPETIPT